MFRQPACKLANLTRWYVKNQVLMNNTVTFSFRETSDM
jgi:hypothetical protein